MTLSSPSWLASGTFWQILFSVFTTFLGVVIGAWLTNKYNNPRRELQYQWRKNTPLLETSTSSASNLTVSHGSTPLAEPRVIDVLLRNQGRKEITSSDFHNGDPITVKLDCSIIELKEVHNDPSTSVPPEVTVSSDKTELIVSPSLLVAGQEVVITVVGDGPGNEEEFSLRSPLVGVRPPKQIKDADLSQGVIYSRVKKYGEWFIAGAVAALAVVSLSGQWDNLKNIDWSFDQRKACALLSEEDAKRVDCPKI
ncbi:hypothetical protein [Streptomyces sp. NPDC058595]|uniref:hypothetical protein n=1 Tax=Streptomyces sp. NPDC058595 TaxID=3346550 RepID=UPI003655392C